MLDKNIIDRGRVDTHPFAKCQEIQRSEGHCKCTQKYIRQSEVRDEQVGHCLHVFVPNHDVTNKSISQDSDHEDQNVNAVEEGFNRWSILNVLSRVFDIKSKACLVYVLFSSIPKPFNIFISLISIWIKYSL